MSDNNLTINENILKISGRCNLISGLKIGKEYDISVTNLECRGENGVPTDDGQVDKIYTLRLSNLSEVNVIGENEIVKSKPKVRTQSQALRWKIEQKWQDTGSDLDKEDFYIKEMSRIITEY